MRSQGGNDVMSGNDVSGNDVAAEMTTETGSEKTAFLFHIRVFLEASVESHWCTDNLAGTSPATRSA